MSSLRLALKQSLQETGHLVPKEKKKRSAPRRDRSSSNKLPRGEPRKRGRPRKRSLSEEKDDSEARKPMDVKEEAEGNFSSENEFSYDSEEEEMTEEEDDDDEGDDHDEKSRQDEGETKQDSMEDSVVSRGKQGETEAEKDTNNPPESNQAHKQSSTEKDASEEREEERRQRKLLKRKLKNSAANKIQNQWKKRRRLGAATEVTDKSMPNAESDSYYKSATGNSKKNGKGADASDKASKEQTSAAETNEAPPAVTVEHKKKRKPGTVPAPSHDILEWSQRMTEKKSRKSVAKGMRVKVRFATKVKREGKIVKKRKWYGGRVSNVSSDGSRIKIKYDDGTSEISQFPDDDVVVDDTDNGQHAQAVMGLLNRFLPPRPRSPSPSPPVFESKEEKKITEKKECGEAKEASSSDLKEKRRKEDKEKKKQEKEQEPMEEKKQEKDQKPMVKQKPNEVDNTEESREKKSPTPVPEESSKFTPNKSKSNSEIKKPRASPETVPASSSEKSSTEKPNVVEADESTEKEAKQPSPEAPKDATAELVNMEDTKTVTAVLVNMEDTKTANNEKFSQTKVQKANPSKPTLKIRISQAKVLEQEKLEKHPETPTLHWKGNPDYSSDEELHADTPVTERKVKSIKVKRKRISGDTSPGGVHPKKRKGEVDQSQGSSDKKEIKAEDREGSAGISEQHKEKSPKKSPKVISITLKKVQSEAPELPSLGKSKKRKDDSNSPVPRGGRKSPVRRSDSPRSMSQDLGNDRDESIIVKPISKKAVGSEKSADLEMSSSSNEQEPKTVLGSKGSAFGKKTKTKDAAADEVLSSKSKASSETTHKAGRKAAQEAKEKFVSRQDEKEVSVGKKKKKRKRKEGKESDEEESDDDDRQWVQCDKCQKWRILPSRMEASSLPDVWYCSLNSWDPKHADCSAPEQTLKQIQKERRRAKKRAKQLRLEQAALEASQSESTTRDPGKKERGGKSATNSPRPTKPVVQSRKNADLESKRASPIASTSNASVEINVETKGEKRGRKGKKERDEPKQVDAQRAAAVGDVTPKKPGRKRGRPARNNSVEAPRPTTQQSKDDDNVEWVQCEKCEKWRKLPPYMSTDELPDKWYCSLNTWNPASASCDAPEDKADAHHQEVGVFGNIPQGHVGKYSYRSMIFGSGRKYNRPMSEKARAAESLFQPPSIEEDIPQTSVMYAKSSMFVPRMSNFQKTQVVEKKNTSIFDVLVDSDLWTELQGVGHAMHILPKNLSVNQRPAFVTYDSLPKSMREQMREIVLQVLGIYVLSGDELVDEALRFPWESISAEFSQIRPYINSDIVINTLLSLVRDGEVEMTCFKDMSVPMTEWVPRYRRVILSRPSPKNDVANHLSPPKTSKCMKISKPWKRLDNSDGWITGGQYY